VKSDAIPAFLGSARAAIDFWLLYAVISKRRAALADIGIDEAVPAPGHARLISITQAAIVITSRLSARNCNEIMMVP
jgi:hypothetical protein